MMNKMRVLLNAVHPVLLQLFSGDTTNQPCTLPSGCIRQAGEALNMADMRARSSIPLTHPAAALTAVHAAAVWRHRQPAGHTALRMQQQAG